MDHTVDGCEILHQLGVFQTYSGINHRFQLVQDFAGPSTGPKAGPVDTCIPTLSWSWHVMASEFFSQIAFWWIDVNTGVECGMMKIKKNQWHWIKNCINSIISAAPSLDISGLFQVHWSTCCKGPAEPQFLAVSKEGTNHSQCVTWNGHFSTFLSNPKQIQTNPNIMAVWNPEDTIEIYWTWNFRWFFWRALQTGPLPTLFSQAIADAKKLDGRDWMTEVITVITGHGHCSCCNHCSYFGKWTI